MKLEFDGDVDNENNNENNNNKNNNNNKIIKILDITQERTIYSNNNYYIDITIIEIFPETDNIFYFLETDLTTYNINEFIDILQYPKDIGWSI